MPLNQEKKQYQSYIATAPGSLMILGEHAVLSGKPALVTAIDQRITVKLMPRADNEIHLHSALGDYQTHLTHFNIAKPFQFVLGTLNYHLSKLKNGCDIEIVSEFSDKVGFGSSAAVTVATLSALIPWLNIRLSPRELIKQARLIVRSFQDGVGSGADVAASVLGGVICYQAQPLFIEKFVTDLPLVVMYSGVKTPTPTVIQQVQENFLTYPQLLRQLVNAIGQCSQEAIRYLQNQDWPMLGKIMDVQQGLMQSLGVSTPLLHNLVSELRMQPTIHGAKISGSGLGDCVIGLGELTDPASCLNLHPEIVYLPVRTNTQGVKCEKI